MEWSGVVSYTRCLHVDKDTLVYASKVAKDVHKDIDFGRSPFIYWNG